MIGTPRMCTPLPVDSTQNVESSLESRNSARGGSPDGREHAAATAHAKAPARARRRRRIDGKYTADRAKGSLVVRIPKGRLQFSMHKNALIVLLAAAVVAAPLEHS